MPRGHDPRPDGEPPRRFPLDAAVLVTCLLGALAAVGCTVLSVWHACSFVVLLLDGGHISARNAGAAPADAAGGQHVRRRRSRRPGPRR